MAMTIPQVTLPEILPVFPLTGVLLFPGTVLPLHVFEPRYRAMVEDALSADRVFGMIQPFAPQQDNRPLPGAENQKWEKLPEGRFFVELKGVNRFRYEKELSLQRGYRRVIADYQNFPDGTLHQGWRCDRQGVLQVLATYGQAHGLQVKPEQADRFSDLELVNLLSVSLPFHPAEKQALLEAATMEEREKVLVDLLRLGSGPPAAGSDIPPRTLN